MNGTAPAASREIPSLGRIVHYIVDTEDVEEYDLAPYWAGKHFPALVVDSIPEEQKFVLQVFALGRCLFIHTPAEGAEPGTWHWPERV